MNLGECIIFNNTGESISVNLSGIINGGEVNVNLEMNNQQRVNIGTNNPVRRFRVINVTINSGPNAGNVYLPGECILTDYSGIIPVYTITMPAGNTRHGDIYLLAVNGMAAPLMYGISEDNSINTLDSPYILYAYKFRTTTDIDGTTIWSSTRENAYASLIANTYYTYMIPAWIVPITITVTQSLYNTLLNTNITII